MATDRQPPLTDSAWFWLLMFSTAAMLALLSIGPKYGRRQEGVERKYETRRETARRINELAAGGEGELRSSPVDPAERELLVPLWGLYACVGAVMLLSGWKLRRWRQSHTGVESS